jgi:hypothetical protein
VSDSNLILITGALLIAGLLATIAAGRLRVPGLVLFIGLGMAVGSDGTGWIDFDDYELARTIGVIALALILFEGGLSVGFGEIRPVLGASLALAIPGTLITAAIAGLAATGSSGSRCSRDCCSGRLFPPPTAPRSSAFCEAHPCGRGSREPWRERRDSTTPWRSCSSSG